MSRLGVSLQSLLSGDTEITNRVDSVSAVICKDEKAENFLVFFLDGVSPADDNDQFAKSGTFTYRIMIMHDQYEVVEELQTEVLRVLNGFEAVNNGNNITELRFINARDDWAEELERYARYITFEITVNE